MVLSGLILEASVRGWDIVIVDGKGTALAGFRNWPGVIRYGLGEPEEMHEALVWVEDLMRERYRKVRDEGVDPKTFRPMLVVLDEFTEFTLAVKKWWSAEGAMDNAPDLDSGKKGKPLREAPSIDSWSSIARLGREGRVHIVVGIQQAASKIFEGTEKRDQLGYRLVLGPTTAESARMMFGRSDIGRDVPQDAKGRGTIVRVKNGPPSEVQTYWTPVPKPDGSMPVDKAGNVIVADAEVLDAFRAAAPARSTVQDTKPAQIEAAPAEAPEPEAPAEPGRVEWIRRTADLVLAETWIRHDGITAYALTAGYSDDDDDTTVIDVRLADGSEEVWELDSNDLVEVRA